MDKFNVQQQFELYLQRSGIAYLPKDSTQYIELRRAFMGAAGQLLILFSDDIGAMEDENEAINVMDSLFNQVHDFWNNERNS